MSLKRLRTRVSGAKILRAAGRVVHTFKRWHTPRRIIAEAAGILLAVITLYAALVALGVLPRPFGDDVTSREVIRQEVGAAVREQLAEYLADLPTTQNETLRAAYEEGRRLQLEGYAAQDAEKHEEAIERFSRAFPLAETDEQRAALYILRGNSYLQLSELDPAEDDYLAALELAVNFESEDERDAARSAALCNLGTVYGISGDLDKAEEHHKKSLAIHEQIGNRLGQAQNLDNLGLVYARRGELEKAEAHHKKSLAIHEEIGNRLGQAAALGNLGTIYFKRGELDKAEQHFKRSLEIHQEMGNEVGQAANLCNLGTLYGDRGELDKAEQTLKKALAIYQQIGNRLGQAIALDNLGIVYADRGELEKAQDYHEQALAIDRQIGNRLGQAAVLGNLGTIYFKRGELDKAEQHYNKALAINEEIGNRLGQAQTLGNLGLLAKQRGDADEALRYLREARAIFAQVGASLEVEKADELIAGLEATSTPKSQKPP